jgi:hypothetical protein
MAAKWTDFVAGAVLEASQLNSVLDNFSDLAIFNETQAANTNGGGSTSGSFLKRTLNTTVVNNITGCSIASSVVTLPAGTFYAYGLCPSYTVQRTKARIYNATDAATLLDGVSNISGDGIFTTVEGTFTLAASKTIELQHRVGTTVTTNGLGVASNFGVNEVYSILRIVRIA